MYGYDTPEELTNNVTATQMYVNPEDREIFKRILSKEGVVEKFEVPFHKKGGETIWASISAHVVKDGQGNITHYDGTIEDITKRKQAEDALYQSEAKYRDLFENAVEGIFQTTPDGRFIGVNPALAGMMRFDSPEQMINTFTDIAKHHYVIPEERMRYRRLLEEQGFVKGFETEVYRKDGNKIWISINARAIRDDKGKIFNYDGTIEDITERKRLEEERRHREKLEGVLEMAGTICHELNQPIQIISGYVDLLSMGASEDSQTGKKLNEIKGQTNRMGIVTKKLMSLKDYTTQDYIGIGKIIDINQTSREEVE
jgi:PAS domain S-box-containing protein